MFIRNVFIIIAFCYLILSQILFSQIILEGIVTDTGSEPVQYALVEVIDQEDSSRVFSSYTNEHGYYVMVIESTGLPSTAQLLQNFPNPFNLFTVIIFKLSIPGVVQLEIYNILGQKIKTLFDGF